MPRRTKAQAAITRNTILNAAECLFAAQGVARTTLQEIASAAGVTRGAVYWHFEDKAALFEALTRRGKLPIQPELPRLDGHESSRPLDDLRDFAVAIMRHVVDNAQARHTFEIFLLKMEVTSDMGSILWQRALALRNWLECAERSIAAAKRSRIVSQEIDARTVSLAIWIMVDGLIRTWLFDSTSFDLVRQGRRMIDTYLSDLQIGASA
jgi:TetR/AcrR family acrAB operon transcriptional repressor